MAEALENALGVGGAGRTDEDVPASADPEYCCRKCRFVLFRESDIFPHAPGEGQNAFTWKKRTSESQYEHNGARSTQYQLCAAVAFGKCWFNSWQRGVHFDVCYIRAGVVAGPRGARGQATVPEVPYTRWVVEVVRGAMLLWVRAFGAE